jgi:two-component system chemotaxis response regulator CheB
MRKIRVLVVDDSVVMRRLLSEVISADPELEVAGYAANGEIALALLDQVAPDIVTLDVEMPVLNGLATLKAMRASHRMRPVIMFSTLTERGAEVTIESLALGASDYVAKPASGGDYNTARERIREALLPRIKALCGKAHSDSTPSPLSALSTERIRHSGRIEVVAIGSSTGGPNALAQLLPVIPASFPIPVLVVQHMPPTFTRFLAQRLSTLCPLPVKEGENGAILRSGQIWVAPGGCHLTVLREGEQVKLQITLEPPENSCRPSADVLFRSVAQAFSSHALAVMLTGMGQDGLRGCELLSSLGAEIVAQDESSSVVWGMPGFVAKAGLADAVLPLSAIGAHIVERVTPFRSQTSRSRTLKVSAR